VKTDVFGGVLIISFYNIPPACGLVRGWQLFTVKEQLVTNCYAGPWKWQVLVNMVMNILGSMKGREFLNQLSAY